MDQFRMEISALYAESLSAVPNFMNVRRPHVRAAMSRRPWESECFFGEHNLTSFVKRICGDCAAMVYATFIILFLEIWALQAGNSNLRSNYILFVPLLSYPWLVAAIVGILINHYRYDADFTFTWRPANYDWYDVIEYGPELEIQHPIREGTFLEDDNFDPFVRTRAQHRFYLYAFVLIWFFTNFALLLSMVPPTPTSVLLLTLFLYSVLLFIYGHLYDIPI